MAALQPRSVGGPPTARLTRREDRSAQLERGPENLSNRAAANSRFLNGSAASAVCPDCSSRVTKSRSSINVMGRFRRSMCHSLEFGLGKPLVLDFAREFLADDCDEVRQIFSRRGAYRRYKELLVRRGALERWYDFSNKSEETALREWCAENGIELSETARPEVTLLLSIGGLDESAATLEPVQLLAQSCTDPSQKGRSYAA
jgi:hypothetical protein